MNSFTYTRAKHGLIFHLNKLAKREILYSEDSFRALADVQVIELTIARAIPFTIPVS
jgi:hypothetical protein